MNNDFWQVADLILMMAGTIVATIITSIILFAVVGDIIK
jgi:hypothetical protein